MTKVLIKLAGFLVSCAFAFFPLSVKANDAIDLNELKAMRKMGYVQAAGFIQANTLINSPEIEDLIEKLAYELLAAAGSKQTVRIHIINDPTTINAFVLPGGDIFIYSGLLDLLDDKDQLALVLSREIAHLVNQDALHNLKTTIKTQKWSQGAITILTPVAGAVASAAISMKMAPFLEGSHSMSTKALSGRHAGGGWYSSMPARERVARLLTVVVTTNLGGMLASQLPAYMVGNMAESMLIYYSSKQENDADKMGIVYAQRAGYDPSAAIELVKKLQNIKQNKR
jgi:predicted Zn-dependent protease